MIKIAFTQRHLSSENGGEERSLYALLRGLDDKGIRTVLFYQRKGDYNHTLPDTVSQYPLLVPEWSSVSTLAFFSSCLKAARILRKLKVDILHVNSYKDSSWAAVVSLLAGVKLGIHLRLNAPHYLSRQYRWAFGRASFFIANSSFVAQDWKAYCPSPISILWNTISDIVIPSITPQSIERPEGKKVLLFVGRIVREKGLHLLAEAFSQLDTSFHLWIVGSDKQSKERGEIQYIDEVKRQLGTALEEGRVTFWGHQANPLTFIRQADLLIIPSLHDSFGRTFLEAVHENCPVIMSACGGMIEVGEKYPAMERFMFLENDAESLKESLVYAVNHSKETKVVLAEFQKRHGSFNYMISSFLETVQQYS